MRSWFLVFHTKNSRFSLSHTYGGRTMFLEGKECIDKSKCFFWKWRKLKPESELMKKCTKNQNLHEVDWCPQGTRQCTLKFRTLLIFTQIASVGQRTIQGTWFGRRRCAIEKIGYFWCEKLGTKIASEVGTPTDSIDPGPVVRIGVGGV